MAGQLDGKVALITGAGTGIAAACARELAAEGAVVACTSLPTDPYQEVVDSITAAGGRAIGIQLDVTKPEEAEQVVERVAGELGGVHILLNNAGITDDQLIMRMRPESWRKVLSVNLDGVFNVTQPTVKVMVRQREGRIISISSVVGLMGNTTLKAVRLSHCSIVRSKLGSRPFSSENETCPRENFCCWHRKFMP